MFTFAKRFAAPVQKLHADAELLEAAMGPHSTIHNQEIVTCEQTNT